MARALRALEGAQEKIKRAKRKLGSLEKTIGGYVASGPLTIRVERHVIGHYVIARIEKLPPDDIAWEMTEAVGHLRDSLDKLMVDLVELNGAGVSGVNFPFGGLDRNTGQPLPFPSGRLGHTKKKLTVEQWAVIESQKPYPGGNDMLWAVNEIANADKHRKGLVTVHPAVANQLSLGNGIGSFVAGPQYNDVVKDKEREMVLFVVLNGTRQQFNIQPTPIVVFGDLRPVQGQNILTTLTQQVILVEGIVQKFAQAFFGPPA